MTATTTTLLLVTLLLLTATLVAPGLAEVIEAAHLAHLAAEAWAVTH